MNDVPNQEFRVPPRGRNAVVRPRDAASLILLRGAGATLEVLVGRRPLAARFMPGVYVFPGGAIDPPDRVAWTAETGTESLAPRLARCARAALRETWEEAGVLVGRPADTVSGLPAASAIERAYGERGLVAAMDVLTLCRPGDHPLSLAPALQYPFFCGWRRERVRRAHVKRRSSKRSVGVRSGGGRSARIGLPRRDAVHVARAIDAQRRRYRRDAVVLLGENARRIGICREAARAERAVSASRCRARLDAAAAASPHRRPPSPCRASRPRGSGTTAPPRHAEGEEHIGGQHCVRRRLWRHRLWCRRSAPGQWAEDFADPVGRLPQPRGRAPRFTP